MAPNTKALTPEELQRAEALLPLLEGKQEFWAMGEFVHLGEPVLPVVTKALAMPGPRIRYNAIETLSMIKSPAAVPALLDTAKLGTNCLAFVSMRSGSQCGSIRCRPRPPLKRWRKMPMRRFGRRRRLNRGMCVGRGDSAPHRSAGGRRTVRGPVCRAVALDLDPA